jgi:uracil-DNA glycosylase
MIFQHFPRDNQNGWWSRLAPRLTEVILQKIELNLAEQIDQGKVIYPKLADIFRSFELTAWDNVKVVILGQDPYHGPNQAMGLAFSVPHWVKIPPSLKNIYKEIHQSLALPIPKHGDLTDWASQGVFLLNAVLTVEAGKAGSHQKQGWEEFTDLVIELLNAEHEHLVFMLWGSHAQKKGHKIDRLKHLVLESVHPSPLSAHRGFLGCEHFKLANDYLKKHNKQIIDWSIPGD